MTYPTRFPVRGTGGGSIASFDAIVIGAGHNGLVAANYLAKAGLHVAVVEQSDRVGGASVTDEIAPGFKVSAAAYVSGLFRPKINEDLELRFGLTEAHQAHGEMGPDQFFSFRPVPGWSNYRMPLKGLYLCGAGTHPGGGVMGAPGYNGAHAVIEDWATFKA